MKKRFDYIDALRGLAALMVLICHSLQIDRALVLPNSLTGMMESGKFGVQLFFIISALTMFYSLANRDPKTLNFFIRRFFRIAPLYFIAVIYYSWLYNADGKGILVNLLFLHGFSTSYINSIVPGGWSIGVEMAFYLLVPLLFKHINSFKNALYFFLFTVVGSFIILYAYKKLIISTPNRESFIYFWLPNQLPVFALGFIIYFMIFQKDKIVIKDVTIPLLGITSLFVFGLVTKLAIFQEHILIAIAFALIIYLLSQKSVPGVVNRGTLFLGKISYSFYLSQYATMEILRRTGLYSFISAKSSLTKFANASINLLLFFITTSIVSYFLLHLIELPFQSLGRKMIRNRQKKLNKVSAEFSIVEN